MIEQDNSMYKPKSFSGIHCNSYTIYFRYPNSHFLTLIQFETLVQKVKEDKKQQKEI